MEDRQKICDLLVPVLQETRDFQELESLKYNKDNEQLWRLSGTEQWKLQMFIWIQEHQWLEILSNRFVNLSYKIVDKPRALQHKENLEKRTIIMVSKRKESRDDTDNH